VGTGNARGWGESQIFFRQFEKRVTSLAAGGGEAGGDFVSDCVQDCAVATPLFSQDHARTELTFGAVVRSGDVGGVREQEPLVAVMSRVFRQVLDVSVSLRIASHLRQLPSSSVVRRAESANRRYDSAMRASRLRHPAHAVNDPGRSSSMMADFFQRNLSQIAKTIPCGLVNTSVVCVVSMD
jgi:hypothetical protein